MKTIGRVLAILLGMTGLRLDLRSSYFSFVLWVVLFFGGAVGYAFWTRTAIAPQVACLYAAAIWALYYVGNSVVLCSSLRPWLIERLGETRALRWYNAVLGLVFAQQGFAQGAFLSAYQGSLSDPDHLLKGLGILLIVSGLTLKIWATYVSGLDIYYYNDMFIGRSLHANQTAVAQGPYRYFKNPMYGVGNLQAYGSALVAGTWEGLLLVGFFNASIYAFYYLFERQFVTKTYFDPAPKFSAVSMGEL